MSSRFAFALMLSLLVLAPAFAEARPIRVIAAENFYGTLAEELGGPGVHVQSILKNPSEDPHLFEITPTVARAIAGAEVVIYNGIGYDPWMTAALRATPSSARRVLIVANLMGKRAGDNPHIWYDPDTMLVLARVLAHTFAVLDPTHASDYATRLGHFVAAMRPVAAKIATMHARFAGTEVAATEPVFNAMFQALGMRVLDVIFETAIMNGTEPGAAAIAALENDLRAHKVALLLTNAQVREPLTERMAAIAQAAGVPVVGVSETEPPHMTYPDWMLRELTAVEGALETRRP